MRPKLKSNSRKKPSSTRPARRGKCCKPASGSRKKPLPQVAHPRDPHGFIDRLLKRVSWKQLAQLDHLRKHPAGRQTHKLSRSWLLVGLVFHYGVHWAGSFAEHLLCLGL